MAVGKQNSRLEKAKKASRGRVSRPKIGIALGGGGAKGLAHILMLEALDELALKPAYVAGTSIGAVIGVLYCSGMKGKELREAVKAMSIAEKDTWLDIITKKRLFKWLDLISLKFEGPGLLKAENFIKALFESIPAKTFEELSIPLGVIAADFWSRTEVVFDSGKLMPAIQASISIPGIFAPVVLGKKVLVDGGAVNPVPFDHLPEDCDLTVAVDVIGRRSSGPKQLPSLTEAIFNTFQIMEKSIIREKLRVSSPDIYIEPNILDVRVWDFHKADTIFKQAQPAKKELKRRIEKKLCSWNRKSSTRR